MRVIITTSFGCPQALTIHDLAPLALAGHVFNEVNAFGINRPETASPAGTGPKLRPSRWGLLARVGAKRAALARADRLVV